MTIAFPIGQIEEWQKIGTAEFEMMNAIAKLGAPVQVMEDKCNITGDINTAADPAGYVIYSWEI
jgi:hypothetical protein